MSTQTKSIIGKTETHQVWVVDENGDLTFFHNSENDDAPNDAVSQAWEYANHVGGNLYKATVEYKIVAAELQEDED